MAPPASVSRPGAPVGIIPDGEIKQHQGNELRDTEQDGPRRRAGLGQKQLAEIIGVGRSAVSNWESARGTEPSVSHMRAHAMATQVVFEWLATGRGEMTRDASLDVPAVADVILVECPRERKLLECFRSASARAQCTLIEFVEIASRDRPRHRLQPGPPPDGCR